MGRIKDAIKRAWNKITTTLTGGVPTNYGARSLPAGYTFRSGRTLAVDSYVSYLRVADGSLVVQTPVEYKDEVLV